jgi:hypothetical protein
MLLRLDDPSLYVHEVRKLAGRRTRDAFRGHNELSLPSLATRAEELGNKLAREVSAGQYRFTPLLPRQALLQGKQRTIYALDPLDAVVWGVFTRVLLGAIEPQLGPHLFSYRKGYSQWTACRGFMHYLDEHRKVRPDPRTRGMFVLRRDVRRYDETIPTGPHSLLWTTIQELCGRADLGFRGDLGAFTELAFRPLIQHEQGPPTALERGVATGIPTQTIACNTYLLPLDRALLSIDGGFLARFGDDILFAHPELERIEQARQVLTRDIERLQLSFNDSKSRDLWLTAPGRPHPHADHYTPASQLAYLGFDVGFAGARLRSDKRRTLWLALRKRLAHTERLLGPASREQKAHALASAVRAMLDRASPLADRYASWLLFDVMSRGALRALDHHIALTVAERVTGLRGVRAFRECPPRELHEEYGLPSLVRSWDRARRNGTSP